MLLHSLSLILPEILLTTLIFGLLLGHLFLATVRRVDYCLFFVILGLLVNVCCINYYFSDFSLSIGIFQNHYFISQQLYFAKALFLVLAALVVFWQRDYLIELAERQIEFLVLELMALLGLLLLISSNSLLMLYLSIELSALSIYVLLAIRHEFNPYAGESALKYFVLSALASAIFLLGVGFIFGATNTFGFSFVAINDANIMLQVGWGLVLLGLFFKLGLVPMHFWLPDVYQGTDVSVLLFFATLPKFAIVIFLHRLWHVLPLHNSLLLDFTMALALLSVAFGYIGALWQDDIKRLLGYSSISNMGFALLAFGVEQGSSMGVLYVAVYISLLLLLLNLMQPFINEYGSKISSLNGLVVYHPAVAVAITGILLAHAGVPPFLGFYPKVLVLASLVSSGNVFVALSALLVSVISIYYYLRIIKTIFVAKPETNANYIANIKTQQSSLCIFLTGALLLISLVPSALDILIVKL